MKVCYVCGYWSDRTQNVFGRRPEDYWNAHFYVWAVKVGSHRRDFYVIRRGGVKTQITAGNFYLARTLFGQFVESCVIEQGWGPNALLVPVPSKDALVGATDPRSSVMVTEAMHNTGLAHLVADCLRWDHLIPKAHQGGERRREQVRPHLRVTADLRGRLVVLIDDLLTRGGTMLAAKDVLEAAGAHVVGGIACGRVMYDRAIMAFGSQQFDLEGELDDLGKLLR